MHTNSYFFGFLFTCWSYKCNTNNNYTLSCCSVLALHNTVKNQPSLDCVYVFKFSLCSLTISYSGQIRGSTFLSQSSVHTLPGTTLHYSGSTLPHNQHSQPSSSMCVCVCVWCVRCEGVCVRCVCVWV